MMLLLIQDTVFLHTDMPPILLHALQTFFHETIVTVQFLMTADFKVVFFQTVFFVKKLEDFVVKPHKVVAGDHFSSVFRKGLDTVPFTDDLNFRMPRRTFTHACVDFAGLQTDMSRRLQPQFPQMATKQQIEDDERLAYLISK